MSQKFQTLPGFRDFYPEGCATRNHVFDTWRRVAKRYGFVEYEGPLLEPTELYRRKSGDEIVTQLFCFEDKGEREVSMRPELTPTLARMAAARQRDFRKPMRWFSIGQFFRYEKQQKGRGREFYQFNCDLLGESSLAADADLVALAIDLMRELGFTREEFRIRLSDRNAWVDFAKRHDIEGESLAEFLRVIDKMDRMPEEKSAALLSEFGLAVGQIQNFIASGAGASDDLTALMEELRARGLEDFVEIDLGIVRGLAYYTGLVFEIFDIGKGMRAVAGGGRYDQLVELIGGVPMPACGFAMGDMVITDLIRETPLPAQRLAAAVTTALSVDFYVIGADRSLRAETLAVVQALRDAGRSVQFSFADAKVGKQFQAAEQSGAIHAVVVGSEFPKLKLKRLDDRSELETNLEEILRTVR